RTGFLAASTSANSGVGSPSRGIGAGSLNPRLAGFDAARWPGTQKTAAARAAKAANLRAAGRGCGKVNGRFMGHLLPCEARGGGPKGVNGNTSPNGCKVGVTRKDDMVCPGAAVPHSEPGPAATLGCGVGATRS